MDSVSKLSFQLKIITIGRFWFNPAKYYRKIVSDLEWYSQNHQRVVKKIRNTSMSVFEWKNYVMIAI